MEFVASDQAPKAIGPYSQAVKAGNLLFTSGQVSLDPATSKLVEGDFDAHARRVFENLKVVLSSGGADFKNVVKATVFLKNFGDFQKLNAVYSEYFGSHKPARTTVEVSKLPLDAPLEIDLVAVI